MQQLNWYQMFKLVKNFYEHHGNIIIPEKFKTLDGITYNAEGYNLSKWLNQQIKSASPNFKKKLSTKKINMLEYVGLNFQDANLCNEDKWDFMFDLARIYFKNYHNLNVPKNFKTTNGFIHNENGYPLGYWVHTQRNLYHEGNLSEKRIEELESLKIKWNYLKEKNVDVKQRGKWQSAYELAEKYFIHNGHSDIALSFKTKDGITYDPRGFALGIWIKAQREDYDNFIINKGDEKYRLLKNIKIIWYPKDHQKNMLKVCQKYNLTDYYVNLLSRLPLKEVRAKIKYLNDHNLPIIENNELNKIFFMSNKNIEVIFSTSYEKIIKDYEEYKAKIKAQ